MCYQPTNRNPVFGVEARSRPLEAVFRLAGDSPTSTNQRGAGLPAPGRGGVGRTDRGQGPEGGAGRMTTTARTVLCERCGRGPIAPGKRCGWCGRKAPKEGVPGQDRRADGRGGKCGK